MRPNIFVKSSLGLLLAGAMIASPGRAVAETVGPNGDSGPTECEEHCFDQWSRNKATCRADHCLVILGIAISCDSGYQDCLNEAKDLYKRCKERCNPQP